MYTHEEAKLVKQKFWTSFGKYMQPVPSTFGEKVNWINYKTGVKGIQFKLDADNSEAFIALEFNHKDAEICKNQFEVMMRHKSEFERIVGNDWDFVENYTTYDGKNGAIVIKKLPNIKIFRETDWPTIISFFKQNMILLDHFWSEWKPAFE